MELCLIYPVNEGYRNPETVTRAAVVTPMLFRRPAQLAKIAATVDVPSGAKLTLGVGAGWHQPKFDLHEPDIHVAEPEYVAAFQHDTVQPGIIDFGAVGAG